MAAIGQVRNVALQMSIAASCQVVFISILIPIGVGIVVHKLAPAFAERMAKPITSISGIGVVACIFVVWISAAPAMWSLIGNGTVIALTAFVLVGLASVTSLAAPYLRIARRWPLRRLHVTPESHSYWPRRTFLRRNSWAGGALIPARQYSSFGPLSLWTKRRQSQFSNLGIPILAEAQRAQLMKEPCGTHDIQRSRGER